MGYIADSIRIYHNPAGRKEAEVVPPQQVTLRTRYGDAMVDRQSIEALLLHFSRAFQWSRTNEGDVFWQDIRTRLQRIKVLGQ